MAGKIHSFGTYLRCAAEFVRITAGGVELESFCIEDEALERVLSALRELGLDSLAKVSLPNGLRRALSMST